MARNPTQGSESCPTTVVERIDYIAERMRTLTWKRGGDVKKLAAQWGLDRSLIRNYSAEASRIVAREVTDPTLIQETVGTMLLKALCDAIEDSDTMRGSKEGLTARDQIARLGRTWADIAGSMPAQKIELTERITPERARQIVAERFGGVTPDAKNPKPEG